MTYTLHILIKPLHEYVVLKTQPHLKNPIVLTM